MACDGHCVADPCLEEQNNEVRREQERQTSMYSIIGGLYSLQSIWATRQASLNLLHQAHRIPNPPAV